MAALKEMVRVLSPGGRMVVVASCESEGAERSIRGGVTIFAGRTDGCIDGVGRVE